MGTPRTSMGGLGQGGREGEHPEGHLLEAGELLVVFEVADDRLDGAGVVHGAAGPVEGGRMGAAGRTEIRAVDRTPGIVAAPLAQGGGQQG